MDSSDTIVVGVSEAASARAAVRYGVHLAMLTDSQLMLAHVVPQATRTGGLYVIAPDHFENAARQLLTDAARLAARTLGHARVSTDLLHGSAVHRLVQAASEGRTVILGADARTPAERFATVSTVVGVSTQCSVPAVVVPSTWSAEAQVPRVTVGVRDVARAEDPLRAGFAAAQERHGRLVVLHVSGLPNEDEDAARPGRHGDLPSLHLADVLAAQVDAVEAEYPDVVHETEIIHGPTAHVLTTWTESCDLLVLERRWHPLHNPHLGRTARALLRTSRCPVLIAPPVPHRQPSASRGAATSVTGARPVESH